MTSHAFGLHTDLYQHVSRVWEWAIELHPNLHSATASRMTGTKMTESCHQ